MWNINKAFSESVARFHGLSTLSVSVEVCRLAKTLKLSGSMVRVSLLEIARIAVQSLFKYEGAGAAASLTLGVRTPGYSTFEQAARKKRQTYRTPFLTHVELRDERAATSGVHPFDLPVLSHGLNLEFLVLPKPYPGDAMRRLLLLFLITGCVSARSSERGQQAAPSRYLYVWAGDADGIDSDFLAVVDVDPASARYGDVVNTVPVGLRSSMPHHLEYELPPDGSLLFANAHHHEQVLLFDFSVADRPGLVRAVGPPSPLRFPHDFLRLPNGNVLVSFLRSDGPSPLPGDTTNPGGHGGIAEFDPDGSVLRTASASDPSVTIPIRPYAFAHLPERDRLLTTSALMMEEHSADVVQIWRMSDLKLLHTLPVLPARLVSGNEAEWGHRLPFEPRVMPDGSVLLSTYGCGFYRVVGLDEHTPTIQNVYMIDPEARGSPCGVPVVVGHYWVTPVGFGNMLISLDVRDPSRPVEVAVLRSDSTFRPHWLARDRGSDRIIVGAQDGGEDRLLMARIDPTTGGLSWDERFGTAGVLGLSLKRPEWPHGGSGDAFAHAALFRP